MIRTVFTGMLLAVSVVCLDAHASFYGDTISATMTFGGSTVGPVGGNSTPVVGGGVELSYDLLLIHDDTTTGEFTMTVDLLTYDDPAAALDAVYFLGISVNPVISGDVAHFAGNSTLVLSGLDWLLPPPALPGTDSGLVITGLADAGILFNVLGSPQFPGTQIDPTGKSITIDLSNLVVNESAYAYYEFEIGTPTSNIPEPATLTLLGLGLGGLALRRRGRRR